MDTPANNSTDPTTIPVLSEVVAPVVQDTTAPVVDTPAVVTDPVVVASPPAVPLTEAEPAPDAIVVAPYPPSTNTIQDFEVSEALPEGWDKKPHVIAYMLSDTEERIEAELSALPNIDLTQTEEGRRWVTGMERANYSHYYKDYYNDTLLRNGAMFRQGVVADRGMITATRPKFSDKSVPVSGERAALRARALTGIGSIVRIPLWHSGFWVSFKAPGDGALLELNRRLADEKVELGRATYGLALANTSSIYASWLVDFAIAHMFDTSLHVDLQPSIRERIAVYDLPILVWGLASVIWPRGFPYSRGVIDPVTKQPKTIEENLNIGKMLFVDNSALTPYQINHMANSNGSHMTADMLDKYRADFTRGKDLNVALHETISVVLKTPSVKDYLVSGQKWVNGIVHMVSQAFGTEDNDTVRNQYISDQGKAIAMRQYSHYVGELIMDGDEVYKNAQEIEPVLNALSENDDIRDTYFNATKKFIEESTIALIAIPVTEQGEVSPLPRYPHLLPIDVMAVFFHLLVQKTSIIQDRS
jgi:hypothetical protein